MTLAVALSQPLAGTRGSLRKQPRSSQRAIKVLAASDKPQEPSKAAGLGPKLVGLLAGAVLLSGSVVPINPVLAAPTLERQARAGAEDATDAIQDKAGSAANAVKRGANKLKGGVEDAGDAIKSAASDLGDSVPDVKDSAKFTKKQTKKALTTSPPQQASQSIMSENHPYYNR